MSNIVYILVTDLQMYKKYLFPKFSTSCRGLKRYGKKMFREAGPTKALSENTHISDKTIHGHKCIDYSSAEQPNAPAPPWLMSSPVFSTFLIFYIKKSRYGL